MMKNNSLMFSFSKNITFIYQIMEYRSVKSSNFHFCIFMTIFQQTMMKNLNTQNFTLIGIESCGQGFLHPDPVMHCNIFPRTKPNPKKVDFMARIEPTRLYSTRSRPNRNILSSTRNYLALDYNKLICEYNQK